MTLEQKKDAIFHRVISSLLFLHTSEINLTGQSPAGNKRSVSMFLLAPCSECCENLNR